MRKLRGLIKIGIIIVFVVIDAFILVQFAVDFAGYRGHHDLLDVVLSIANLFIKPFDGVINPYETSTSIVNFSALLSLGMVSLLFVEMLSLVSILLSDKMGIRITSLFDNLIVVLEVILIIGIIFHFLPTNEVGFLTSFNKLIDLLTLPIHFVTSSILKITLSKPVEIIFIMSLLVFIWYIVIQVLEISIPSKTHTYYGAAPAAQPSQPTVQPAPKPQPVQTQSAQIQQEVPKIKPEQQEPIHDIPQPEVDKDQETQITPQDQPVAEPAMTETELDPKYKVIYRKIKERALIIWDKFIVKLEYVTRNLFNFQDQTEDKGPFKKTGVKVKDNKQKSPLSE